MGNAPQIREGDETPFLSHLGRIVDKEKDAGGGFCVKSPPDPTRKPAGIDTAFPSMGNAPQMREGDEASLLSHPGRIVDRESANRYTPIGFGERYGEPAFDFKRRFPIKSP